MIKHICPICKRKWYCKGCPACEHTRDELGKPMGGCICSNCTDYVVPEPLFPDCELVKYEDDWRIA